MRRKGDGRVFSDIDEIVMAYDLNQVDIHAHIKIQSKLGTMKITTA